LIRRFGICFILLGAFLFVKGQQNLIPLNYQINQEIGYYSAFESSPHHVGARPLVRGFNHERIYRKAFVDTGKYYYDLTVLLFQKNLLQIDRDDVHLTFDPLIDFAGGASNRNTLRPLDGVLYNTRAFRITGEVTDRVYFETNFYENQFYFPVYIDSVADQRGLVPGLGRSKPFKLIGHDIGTSTGLLSIGLTSNINLQFGHGKLFYGHGYRSVLLSDGASNYPYLSARWQSKNRKWQYHSNMAWLQTMTRLPATNSVEALFIRKGGNFNYLSYVPNRKWEFGLFEGKIFDQYDSLGIRNPSLDYFIPIIGLGSGSNFSQEGNNVITGLNLLYKLDTNIHLYGQIASQLNSKISSQLGVRWFNPLDLEKTWISFEWNQAPKYMYLNSEEHRFQNYAHSREALAHILGAGFNEVVLQANTQYGRGYSRLQSNYSIRRSDDNFFYGADINSNTSYTDIATDEKKFTSFFLSLETGMNLNIKTRMQLYAKYTVRTLSGDYKQSENFWLIGLRTNLRNIYHDF